MGDAELRKRAADQSDPCLANDRDHVPSDFRVHHSGRKVVAVTCHLCGVEVRTDG